MAPYLDEEQPPEETAQQSLSVMDLSDPASDASEDTYLDSGDESGPVDEAARKVTDENVKNVPALINRWYRNVSARRVDLIGDYAGNELFLVEGDSMLQRCFADDKLDFDHGFQVLHAVYNVEKFLQGLAQRKCNFHIAFVDEHESLCIPLGASESQVMKYLLTRAIIIRHLQRHLPKSYPSVKISRFASIGSKAFRQYLSKSGMYFIMAHDGASPLRQSAEGPANERITQEEKTRHNRRLKTQPACFRLMLADLMGMGYNIALINGLGWQDTKVMTMVLETNSRHIPHLRTSKTNTVLDSLINKAQGGGTARNKVEEQISRLPDLTAFHDREIVTLLALNAMLTQDALQKPFAVQLLFQMSCLVHLALASRQVESIDCAASTHVSLIKFADHCRGLLNDDMLDAALLERGYQYELADLVDGRLLNLVINADAGALLEACDRKTHEAIQNHFEALIKSLEDLSGTDLDSEFGSRMPHDASAKDQVNKISPQSTVTVLPFSNKVFDKHLQSIHLTIDSKEYLNDHDRSSRIFKELSHWHNASRPLTSKAMVQTSAKDKEWRVLRRQQWFMAEMQKYAASLTNAVGIGLDPETIIVGTNKVVEQKEPPLKKGAPGKQKNDKNARKNAMLADIAATSHRKDEASADKIARAWQVTCKSFEAESDLQARYVMITEYLGSLKGTRREVIGPEVELYMLNTLVSIWIEACRTNRRVQESGVAAIVFDIVKRLAKYNTGITNEIAKAVKDVQLSLHFPDVFDAKPQGGRSLPFKVILPLNDAVNISAPGSSEAFQLTHCGPYLERSIDSKSDRRVPFSPDGWQRDVLDEIDAQRSLLVVAPTSAGKTFISFYAMKRILENDDDGVLVYVAPTKALVNQIAAEIQARFSKTFKRPGKSVWAIHTRDYRINSPVGCQVLVTVPHILQIMLLAPDNAISWSSRVKQIIFDEVHSIGQADDGLVWEQLLLLAPCPIIALSATIGNPEEFNGWLDSTQKALGNHMTLIEHSHRYSDLRKFVYTPTAPREFKGLPERAGLGRLGLDQSTEFTFMHPVVSLVNRSRGMPRDLNLEARDCLQLYESMKRHQTSQFPLSETLDPSRILPAIIRKVDIFKWETALKTVFCQWMSDDSSPFESVMSDLTGKIWKENDASESNNGETVSSSPRNAFGSSDRIADTTLPLLCSLQAQDALPAILFSYERSLCERICHNVLDRLKKAEDHFKATNPVWLKKMKAWEEWKKAEERKGGKSAPKKTSKKKGSRGDDDDDDSERLSKLDMQKDAGSGTTNPYATFNPEAPLEAFSFADNKKLLASELAIHARRLRKRGVIAWLGDALERGIGVHHAGMNRAYRQVVEMLFRKGFLRVVIATGTLALGINMPTRTVVFSGDSVFLTALNYRQASGRAGRRGFDVLGNVVFHEIPSEKICRLVSSRLPDLNGHFPITTTLVLRLCTLLHETKYSKHAVRSVDSLLSQPRLYLGSSERKAEVLHHLRFSIEYLRRQQLLDGAGAPLNFAGLVSHLYFTENSAFAFQALLKAGYFHSLCSGLRENPAETIRTLMLVMAHLFGRRPFRQADREFLKERVKRSPSVVFLPKLPDQAARTLTRHNEETKAVFQAYVSTFVDQHIKQEEKTLPLTGLRVGGEYPSDLSSRKPFRQSTRLRSPFVALSGWDDTFKNVKDLCHTVRQGVFLEEAVVPHFDVYPQDMDEPLNAYLYDFFRHGNVSALESANLIRKSDVWFLLNDFSMVLATIVTSMKNFLKLSPASDMDMLDINGAFDAHEEEEEGKLADFETMSGTTAVDSEAGGNKKPIKTKSKSKVADTWQLQDEHDEDEMTDEEDDNSENVSTPSLDRESDGSLVIVLAAFQRLNNEFNTKFRAMWA
ncbi:MAG: hypothetical protein M1828_004183 [Chrysothrix sp. TS-e1954]|nr:MAG: hypothetical protein M1828_004183 [Chrysothrix sp. TS-e1954]